MIDHPQDSAALGVHCWKFNCFWESAGTPFRCKAQTRSLFARDSINVENNIRGEKMESRQILWTLAGLIALGCGSDKRFGEGLDEEPGGLSGGDADTDTDADADADADADGGSSDDGDGANVRGMITVELYEHDDDGARVYVPWDEAVGEDGDFPFGSIFVAGFRSNEEGVESYYDQYTITRPHTDGDFYALSVDPSATSVVNVYAAIDVRSDGIVGSAEPMGIHPSDIIIEDGTEADDVNVSILIDWERWGPGGWGWYQSGSGGPHDAGCDIVSMSGPVEITVPYGGGNGQVMTLDTRGNGPYKIDPFTPIATPDGAEADYQLGLCEDSGQLMVVGAYDSNGNGLIDPSDLWGAYASETGVDGNPVTIEDESIRDATVEIPLNDGVSPLNIIPFVQLSGTANAVSASTFAGMSEVEDGAALYIAAMKYRMNAEFPISAFENAYDFKVWGPDALGSSSSVDWRLMVPANTVVYLWAYVDVDGNFMVNEVSEPVASSGGDSTGALRIGDEDQADIELNLVPADD